jgi:hypothetical protein
MGKCKYQEAIVLINAASATSLMIQGRRFALRECLSLLSGGKVSECLAVDGQTDGQESF